MCRSIPCQSGLKCAPCHSVLLAAAGSVDGLFRQGVERALLKCVALPYQPLCRAQALQIRNGSGSTGALLQFRLSEQKSPCFHPQLASKNLGTVSSGLHFGILFRVLRRFRCFFSRHLEVSVCVCVCLCLDAPTRKVQLPKSASSFAPKPRSYRGRDQEPTF